jgi:hypothetical protein
MPTTSTACSFITRWTFVDQRRVLVADAPLHGGMDVRIVQYGAGVHAGLLVWMDSGSCDAMAAGRRSAQGLERSAHLACKELRLLP